MFRIECDPRQAQSRVATTPGWRGLRRPGPLLPAPGLTTALRRAEPQMVSQARRQRGQAARGVGAQGREARGSSAHGPQRRRRPPARPRRRRGIRCARAPSPRAAPCRRARSPPGPARPTPIAPARSPARRRAPQLVREGTRSGVVRIAAEIAPADRDRAVRMAEREPQAGAGRRLRGRLRPDRWPPPEGRSRGRGEQEKGAAAKLAEWAWASKSPSDAVGRKSRGRRRAFGAWTTALPYNAIDPARHHIAKIQAWCSPVPHARRPPNRLERPGSEASSPNSEALLHEEAERVRPVGAERATLDIAEGAVEGQRLGLLHPRLQLEQADARLRRGALEMRQKRTPDATAARARVDEQALDLGLSRRPQREGDAADRATLDPRDQQADIRRGQRLEVDRMPARGRIERREIGVRLPDQLRDLGLTRRFRPRSRPRARLRLARRSVRDLGVRRLAASVAGLEEDAHCLVLRPRLGQRPGARPAPPGSFRNSARPSTPVAETTETLPDIVL